jgi:CubicO group peptidase (beta-lactamase class C family)
MVLPLTLCVFLGGDCAHPYPGAEWEKAEPAEVGLRLAPLEEAARFAGGSGCVIRHGKRVFSWGSQSQRYALLSTTKSIGGSALGLALADGLMELSSPAHEFHLPGSFGVPPEENRATGWIEEITIFHLVTHTAGFDKPGGYFPLLFRPGTRWHYSDGGSNWLGECLTITYGRDLLALLTERLFQPLGIDANGLTWRDRNLHRPQEVGGIRLRELNSGMAATVDAMARIGYLYLRRGRWGNEQLLPADFVDQAASVPPGLADIPGHDPRITFDAPRHYGLLWWNNADGSLAGVPADAYWSWGLGESLIVVVPSLDLVFARAGPAWQEGWLPDYRVIEPFLELVAGAAEERRGPCAPPIFHRGDPDGDGVSGVTDAIFLLHHFFFGTSPPLCLDSADGNGDGAIDISDPIFLLLYAFAGGFPPPPPGPPGSPCGPDPKAKSEASLGCELYTSCSQAQSYPNSSAIGLPWSVMGTGRSPAWSSLAESMPSAVQAVAKRSGTEIGRSMMLSPSSSVRPTTRAERRPPPASTTVKAFE